MITVMLRLDDVAKVQARIAQSHESGVERSRGSAYPAWFDASIRRLRIEFSLLQAARSRRSAG
jgi:hypothetical protein